jgi:hypothetical protein
MTTKPKELNAQAPESLGGLSLVEYKTNRQLLAQVMHQEMKAGVDYGVTPGTSGKPSLWKPGAEKLTSMFAFAPSFTYTVEKHEAGHRTYDVKCTLRHRGSDVFLGDADAVCSTLESKYTAQKSKPPADFYNTALKMAEKRALIAVVLFVTAASDIFTQDIDDDDNGRQASGLQKPAGKTAAQQSTTKTQAGLWRGELMGVTEKTFKGKDGTSLYYILVLKDGRSASTFDEEIAAAARQATGAIVEIETKPGKKAGFFNVMAFGVVSGPEEEPKPTAEPDLEDIGEQPF